MNKEELKKQIIAANAAYRDGHPVMDDQSFDDLCEKLEQMMPADEWSVFRDSLNEGKGKVKHPFIMGSLDKLKSESPAEVKKFVKTCSSALNVSAKVDGISCRLHYENGILTSASTRGDGFWGEDISDKIKHVNFIPMQVDTMNLIGKNFDIRGELVILKDDFAKMSGFSNPRNAVAGIINRKDWKPEDVNNVSFIAYTILGKGFTKNSQFKTLRLWGFNTAWSTEITNPDDSIVEELFEFASQSFEYETDGLVICSSEYVNEEKYRPTNCKAFKINLQVAETKLVDVSWEGPSKDGVFIGVGILDPVELGGATITRVTLHNLDVIEELGLMYGSVVRIRRSGDVIPYIEAVVENDEHCTKIVPPSECSCCGSKLVRDGVNMRCMNKACPDQVINRLVGFIKKLGVKSASNATLKNFGITSFEKLIAFVPDKKYKSEVKLYDELYAKVFSQSKEKLLGAMNFVGLSETLIYKIVSHYGYANVESMSLDSSNLPAGVGQTTLDKFIEGLPDALRYVNLVANDTRWHWTPCASGASSSGHKIIGSICVTGSLDFGSRNKFLDFAKEHGYESKSGVSKGLTYLVNNDINSNSSKNRKAKELGIKIITEAEFMKICNANENEVDLTKL